MKKLVFICPECRQKTKHRCKGLCARCYDRQYRAGRRADPAYREAGNARVRKHAATKTPEERYDRQLQYKFGIDLEEYYLMLEDQGGVCAVCKTDDPGIKRKFFAVDHNHLTGRIRGLLCNGCNFAAGWVQDNYIVAETLSKYLKRHGMVVDILDDL